MTGVIAERFLVLVSSGARVGGHFVGSRFAERLRQLRTELNVLALSAGDRHRAAHSVR